MLWGSNWAAESKFTADRNLYWSEAGEPEFLGKSLAEWQQTGRGVNSVVADPGFVDAANRDFTLGPDSPALELGFEPIDMSPVGLYGDEAWTQLPAGLAHRTYEEAPPGPIVEDFEYYEPGEEPAGAVTATETTSVTVIDDNPASGVRCARFVDGSDPEAWRPHWWIRRKPGEGTVRMACSVRNDPDQPATFGFEFRDWPKMGGATYATGPHLRFMPDGTLQAVDGPAWRVIGRCDLGEWVRVEVTFQEAADAEKTYTVKLDAPAEAGTTTDALSFRHDTFSAANWFGFAGMGNERAAFYVDDFRLE